MDSKPKAGMSAAHLSKWQRRSFDISSGTCAPEQKADAIRGHILDIQYAWSSSLLSGAATGYLLRGRMELYAAVLDLDDPQGGLNNYAESVLHLARGHRNESVSWRSALTLEGVLAMPCVRSMLCSRSASSCPSVTPVDADVVVGKADHGASDVGSRPVQGTGMASAFPEPEGSGTPNDPRREEAAKGGCLLSLCLPPVSTSRPQPGVTPLFATGSVANMKCPTQVHSVLQESVFPSHQPVFCPSSNPYKRKVFYGSVEEKNRGLLPTQGAEARSSYSVAGKREVEGHSAAFRSAREQLVVEQQKKHGHQPQRAQLTAPSAGIKKSLGANRPRGAFSKFVSPLPRQEGCDGVGGVRANQDQLQPIDDRLKNFEPKIIELIMSEIMDHGPPVSWEDIAGLEFAKATIQEIVVWPMLRPDIFTGLRGPPKGILLFGPPGTGKTLIGKCIACQSGATFFSISASSLTSKWVGEGEKMVRALFAIAHCQQPAVIFIDEIDSLLSQRTDGEHDSSRRIKTEFLVQLDGAATSADDRILVVGATNRPHEIDEAARRRLAKRLYVPLPEAAARRQIVVNLMAHEKCQVEPEELEKIVVGSQGFSGADMTQLCREAALGPIRSIRVSDIATILPDQVRPILYADFQEALKTVRPSVSPKDLELYEEWNKTFGCGR
ncbi:hypothetical protein Z043_120280 [Scleropages formosus]|uniref:Fidgetin-like protein 1 n=1 Tax=Scleropages formosus TaxID=113540 RepID=A0A0N8JWQ6_SCLFO|nr:hypothetical protein Z043_120280 [Scleropages formosus]